MQVESAERARVQAYWVLNGALDWARLILREDARQGGPDYLAEPWAVALAPARLTTFLAAERGEALVGACADVCTDYCDITGEGFRRLLGFIKPGVGEWEIEAELLHEFRERSGIGHSRTRDAAKNSGRQNAHLTWSTVIAPQQRGERTN